MIPQLAKVVWITGLSGAGKTTTAKLLQKKLFASGVKAVLLDGDDMREALGFVGQYSPEERKNIAFTYAKLAKLVADQGLCVIVSTISMFDVVREWNRKNNSCYIEIYLQASDEERRRRDTKKLYVSNQDMVDVGGAYEMPKSPDMIFHTDGRLSPEMVVEKIQEVFFK